MGEYHGLYLKSDTLLLSDVFENFRKMCLEIYELDPAKYFPAPELAWQAALKKTKVKLELLTDIDMQLMVEKGTRSGLCHSINNYAKANNKYMKDHYKNKESSYLKYCDVNNLYVNNFAQQCRKNCLQMDLTKLKIFLNLMKILLKVKLEKVMKEKWLTLIILQKKT